MVDWAGVRRARRSGPEDAAQRGRKGMKIVAARSIVQGDGHDAAYRREAASFNKVTGANSRPASQFESRGLRRRALVVEGHGRYHGGAAVAQFCR